MAFTLRYLGANASQTELVNLLCDRRLVLMELLSRVKRIGYDTIVATRSTRKLATNAADAAA